jgi:hypothetical protein
MKSNLGIILAFIWVVMVLGGCVSIEYHAAEGVEDLTVKTFLKSLDGLAAERDEDGFGIIIDKTYTNDPMRGIMDLMETYEQLYGLGIRYDPVAQPIRSTEE